MSWRWVSQQALVLLHDESLAEHGGSPGLRDTGLLESALARPKNLAAYESPDHAALAASYGVGLAKSHAYVDGNKRAAFLAAGLFLHLNGHRLVTTQADATQNATLHKLNVLSYDHIVVMSYCDHMDLQAADTRTLVTLLPGQQTADDLLWQQVRTEAGVEGWVARDFLAISEQ